MATVTPFPAPLSHPGLRERRASLGPLTGDERAGWRALCDGVADGEPDGIAADVLADYLAADVGAATWKSWLLAYGNLQALP